MNSFDLPHYGINCAFTNDFDGKLINTLFVKENMTFRVDGLIPELNWREGTKAPALVIYDMHNMLHSVIPPDELLGCLHGARRNTAEYEIKVCLSCHVNLIDVMFASILRLA